MDGYGSERGKMKGRTNGDKRDERKRERIQSQ